MFDASSLIIKIARSENLPVLPQVASAILKLADDPNATSRDVERLIESDPAIMAKILRVANSAQYNAGAQITSIGRALSLLGLNTVKSLVVSLAYQQMIGGRKGAAKFDRMEFWKHSLAVATGARVIALLKVPDKVEELFMCGLMHDVGILVMDRFAPDPFDQAIENARNSSIRLCDAEQRLLGFDHTAVGAILAERWGLTGTLRQAIVYHHKPMHRDAGDEASCVIHIADAIAHQGGFENTTPGVEYEVDEGALDILGMPPEQLDAIRLATLNEVIKVQQSFQIR